MCVKCRRRIQWATASFWPDTIRATPERRRRRRGGARHFFNYTPCLSLCTFASPDSPPTHPLGHHQASMDTPTTVGPISPVSSTYACEETKEGVTDSPIKNRTGAFKKSLTPLLQMSDRNLEVLCLGLVFDTGPAQPDLKNRFCIEGRLCGRRKRGICAKRSCVPNERRTTMQYSQAHNFWRKVSGSTRSAPQKPPLIPSKGSLRQRHMPQSERPEEDSELDVFH